ncbi:enoyl-CoA hydratase/isomerase family protein [soil metagenome]
MNGQPSSGLPMLPALPVLFHTLPTADGRQLGVATLNAEKSLNALSMEMVTLLSQQLHAWDADPAIVMVLLQAAGDKAFCAGGDLQDLYASMRDHQTLKLPAASAEALLANRYALDFFTKEYRLDYQIHTYRKPLLCWGHGIVMGGGIGLMAGASHRVVTERSRLAMPETAIGLFPDVGGSWFLPRMPGKLGLFLALSGAAINAADAVFVKLADYQLPHAAKAALLASLQAQSWSEDAAANHLLLSNELNQQLNQQLSEMASEQLSQPGSQAESATASTTAGPLRRHFDLINQLCSSASLAQTVAQISALDSSDPWLQKASAALKKACPGSLWLAHALQTACHHSSLAEVFRAELVAALACAADADFAEGIRALLIDKDQQPQWQQPDLLADHALASLWGQRFFNSPWSAQQHPLRDLGQELEQQPEQEQELELEPKSDRALRTA